MPYFLILLLFLFASCASPPQVRDFKPTRVETIQKEYQTLAKCTIQRIEGFGIARKARVSFDEQKKMIRISEPFGFVHNQTKFEFQFTQIKENQTKVESYGYETLVGRAHYPNQVWPYVMQCAGKENFGTKANFPGTTK